MTIVKIEIAELKTGGLVILTDCVCSCETDVEKQTALSLKVILEDKLKELIKACPSQPTPTKSTREQVQP